MSRAISVRVVPKEAAGEALMMTAGPMTVPSVAGVCAGGLPGTEVGVTTSG